MSRDERREEKRDVRCDGEIDMTCEILLCHVWVAWYTHSHIYL